MRRWLANRVSEKDVRDWLSENGYDGKSAQFMEMELHAIQRPGWLQIFRFEFTGLSTASQRVHLWGAMRSDERYGRPAIFVYSDESSRDAQLADWSAGLITHRRRKRR